MQENLQEKINFEEVFENEVWRRKYNGEVKKIISISVCDIHKNDSNKYVKYKLSSKVIFTNEIHEELEIFHRYSDFHQLNQDLKEICKNNKLSIVFPNFPEKTYFGGYYYDVEGYRVSEFNKYFLEILKLDSFIQNDKLFSRLSRFILNGEVKKKKKIHFVFFIV